jgi:hypothetical protein
MDKYVLLITAVIKNVFRSGSKVLIFGTVFLHPLPPPAGDIAVRDQCACKWIEVGLVIK